MGQSYHQAGTRLKAQPFSGLIFPNLIAAGLSEGLQELWQPHPLAPKPKALLPLPRGLLFPNKALQGHLTLPGSSPLASSRKSPLRVLRPAPCSHLACFFLSTVSPPIEGAMLPPHFLLSNAGHAHTRAPPERIQPPTGSRCAGQSLTNVCRVHKMKPREWRPSLATLGQKASLIRGSQL